MTGYVDGFALYSRGGLQSMQATREEAHGEA